MELSVHPSAMTRDTKALTFSLCDVCELLACLDAIRYQYKMM